MTPQPPPPNQPAPEPEESRELWMPDLHFGRADAPPLDWRKYKDDSPDDDEELEETPPSIVEMLGFDPRTLDDDE